jgi:hypothetical protein
VAIHAADYPDNAESRRERTSLNASTPQAPQKLVNDYVSRRLDQLLSREDTASRDCHLVVPEPEAPL